MYTINGETIEFIQDHSEDISIIQKQIKGWGLDQSIIEYIDFDGDDINCVDQYFIRLNPLNERQFVTLSCQPEIDFDCIDSICGNICICFSLNNDDNSYRKTCFIYSFSITPEEIVKSINCLKSKLITV